MTHNQENLSNVSMRENSEVSKESVTAWRRPDVTIIDIKRTMLIAGSVTDGISGSI